MAPAKKTKAITNGTKKTETKPVEKKVTKAAATKATETKTEAKKPAGKKLAPKKTNKIAELPTPPTKKPNAKTKATKATEDKKETPAKKPVKKAAAAAKPAKKAAAKPAKKAAAKPAKKAASKKQEDDIEAALANEVDSSQDEDSSDEETEEKDFGDLESLIPFDKTYRSALTKLETQIKQGKDTRLGVVYVGRIPHKIQEKDLKIYFGQFGTIAHTRIARNPLTGRSRHYAFIQYKSQEVADIVVETMDNHLFGGRLLKVKSVPKDKVHPMLFTGERTNVSEEHNRKRTQSKITKQKDAKLTPYVKKRIESEMEKTQKAIKESGINYEVPKKLLAKKTDKPMIETKKTKAKTN